MELPDEDAVVSSQEIIVKAVHKVGLEIAPRLVLQISNLLKESQAAITLRPAQKADRYPNPLVIRTPWNKYRLYHVEKYSIIPGKIKNQEYVINYWVNILCSKALGLRKRPLVGILIKVTVNPPLVTEIKVFMYFSRDTDLLLFSNAISEWLKEEKGLAWNLIEILLRTVHLRLKRKLGSVVQAQVRTIGFPSKIDYRTTMPIDGKFL